MNNKTITQFGFEQVTLQEKAKLVDDVFTNVSSVYDRMNDFMSLGQHHYWKQHAVTALRTLPEHTVADIACGSGDISALLAPQLSLGKLICIDPNTAMLAQCKQRLSQYHNLLFIESSAEKLNLPHLLDRAIISFGLRNFTDPELGLKQVFQHLKPGGKLVIMEFNPPKSTHFAKPYALYLNQILPIMGKYIAQDEPSYQYLTDSIMIQPTPQERLIMLFDLGYRYTTYSSLNFGVVGLFEAYRCP